jgi:hypothetical protein
MRWLMIGLLVSLGALLFAAAGAARHIWKHRTKLDGKPPVNSGHSQDQAADSKQNPNQAQVTDPTDEQDL